MEDFGEQVTLVPVEGGSPKHIHLVCFQLSCMLMACRPVISTLIGASSIPSFVLIQLSHSPVFGLTIERLLILSMVRHVLSNPDANTLISTRNLK